MGWSTGLCVTFPLGIGYVTLEHWHLSRKDRRSEVKESKWKCSHEIGGAIFSHWKRCHFWQFFTSVPLSDKLWEKAWQLFEQWERASGRNRSAFSPTQVKRNTAANSLLPHTKRLCYMVRRKAELSYLWALNIMRQRWRELLRRNQTSYRATMPPKAQSTHLTKKSRATPSRRKQRNGLKMCSSFSWISPQRMRWFWQGSPNLGLLGTQRNSGVYWLNVWQNLWCNHWSKQEWRNGNKGTFAK